MRGRLVLAAMTLAVFAACSSGGPPSGTLGPVDRLAAPVLPAWIASVSPLADARTLAQIRVIFAKPVASVGELSGAGPRAVLDHLALDPKLPGAFVVLTPKMIGFVPERALPVGTRVRVTLTAGLADLAGDKLENDVAWTFETEPLGFSQLPGGDPDAPSPAPTGLTPSLAVTANAAVDVATLAAHASLVAHGRSVPLDAKLEKQATPDPGDDAGPAFDPSQVDYVYDLTPKAPLEKGTTYALTIAPGVMPAGGNVATAQTFKGTVVTYGPFGVANGLANTSDGRFAGGDPLVEFTNPVDPKSLAGNVTLSPTGGNAANAFKVSDYTPSEVTIDPFALRPRSTYTVTFGPKVADTFGQTLGTAKSVTVRTQGFAPGLWAPSGTNIFPAGSGVAMDLYATNLPGDAYRATYVPVSPPGLALLEGSSKALGDWSNWPQRTLPNAKPDAQSVVRVPVAAILGRPTGTLAYGIAAKYGDYPTTYTGAVQLTDLGVFAQIFPNRAAVAVQHLSDGSPAAGAAIAVYRVDDANDAQRCATGTTGANGTYDLTGTSLAACYAGVRAADEAPQVAVMASSGADWTIARIHSYDGIFAYDVDGGWVNGKPLSRGTIFSDRQMYQPGESARITGVAYYVRGGSIVADANAAYALAMLDPAGKKKPLGTLTTDAHGVFTATVAFAPTQALGYYSLVATGSSGNEIDGSVRVAAFKPPNFKLDVALAPMAAVAGSDVTALAKGAYLFGTPLAGAKAKIAVTRDVAYLAPKGLDGYSFGRQWFWPDQQPSFDTDVLQSGGTFDASGAWTQKVPVPADLPFPMTYSVDVTASDATNASVDTTQTFTALASDAVIGLQSGFVAKAGDAMNVSVVASDLDGHLQGGRDVELVLQKMTYGSATQLDEGSGSAENGVQYTTVETVDATTGSAAVTATLHPKDPGPYRVRANFAGAKSDASATDIQTFVIGAGDVDWGGDNPNAVQIKLDKKSYKVGETATALIASPYAKSDVYIAVIRNDVIWKTVLHVAGNGPKVSFAVTPAMVPNAAIEALVVRRGTPVKPGTAGAPDSLARIGVAGFTTDVRDRYLKIGIAPRSASLEPGAHQTVALAITDMRGKPARSEAIVMVVNEAILQLTGYRPPDLVQTVYASQPISVRFSDSRTQVVLKTQTPTAEKGWGYGGGFLAGAGSTRVRTDFRPMAYYRVVETDANGKASVDFALPDDLTTWRTMVVAVGDDDAHFGTADATFVATKPLLTNPLLPQFGRPGDLIDAGMSALDASGGAGGAMTYDAKLTGALTFASGDPRSASGTANVGAQLQAIRLPMAVGTPAPTTLSVASRYGDLTDAFRVPFVIRDAAVTESNVDTGATSASASVPIEPHGGRLTLTVSNSAVTQVAVPAAAAMRAEPQPFLDDAASRAAIATATLRLAPRYHLQPGYDAAAARADALDAIAKLQRADGGFASFGDADESDPFATAYAAPVLSAASAAGAGVPAAEIAGAKAYLARTLADPTRYKWCGDAACRARLRFEMLWALDALGDRRSDFLSDIVVAEPSFDAATQIRLARYLLRVPGWESRGAALAADLEQSVYRTGRYGNANVGSRWSWLGDTVAAQAQMLQLLVQRGAPADETDGAVRALAAQSCACGWPTLDAAAQAMNAIADYASHEKTMPFDATVGGAGMPSKTVHFGAAATSQAFSVDASTLRKGALTIAARGGGTVHYVVLYTYPVPPDAPGTLAGLRVVRDVRPAGQSGTVANMDLAAIRDPFAFGTGGIYDVGVRVIVDHPVDGVAIEDPLPAGFEAVDSTLKTATTALVVDPSDSWAITERQIYPDRVFGYAAHLEPGIYEMHYLARAVTPGTYRWPGARAYLRAAPEQFGRTASSVLKLQ